MFLTLINLCLYCPIFRKKKKFLFHYSLMVFPFDNSHHFLGAISSTDIINVIFFFLVFNSETKKYKFYYKRLPYESTVHFFFFLNAVEICEFCFFFKLVWGGLWFVCFNSLRQQSSKQIMQFSGVQLCTFLFNRYLRLFRLIKWYSPAGHSIFLKSAFTSTFLEKDGSEETSRPSWSYS